MKARLKIATCLVVLVFFASSAFAQKNRLDITLEGPWILFQVKNFDMGNGSGKTVPVVIAMAPGVAGTGKDNFHFPTLSTGDGYYIDIPRIYCVTFAGKCAENVTSGPLALLPDHYPEQTPLNVKAKWDWVSAYKKDTYVTALILPMPDSYSNDGVFPMRFANKFDPAGTGYVPAPKHPSIGVQFHYAQGPDYFDIRACGNSPTVATCNLQPDLGRSYTRLENSGTLRIVMKARETTVVHPSKLDTRGHV